MKPNSIRLSEEFMELREFDYSVRVTLASSTLCAQQTPSVALKLHVADENGVERPVMLELNEQQLEKVLRQFAMIREELMKKPPK